eukprot:Phypoly_transcript_06844.p1 GENE.Phypoly_transcript_06844~~Phypoly_transcript_06844.p1  ORF type:complete len:426 (+),score=90.17 Phypoly_transcript_06844:126-1403(+)
MQLVLRDILEGSSSDGGHRGGYTMPVVGIFVIMVLGLTGSLIPPLVALYLPKFDLNNRYGFRFFNGLAAGVVLGVAYIHSIPDGIDSFDDAMAGKTGYTATYAWGGLLAMMGSLLTFICEEFVHRRVSRFAALHGHAHHHDHDHDHAEDHDHKHEQEHEHKHKHKHEHKHKHKEEKEKKDEQKTKEANSAKSDIDSGSGSSDSDCARALEEGTFSDSSTSLSPPPSPGCVRAEIPAQASNTKDLDVVVAVAEEEEAHPHAHDGMNDAQIGYYTELYVLLFGLSFHSLFVGIALGVSGNDWGLFAAIIFHQFFEGLALGARVARAGFKKKAHIWLLDVVYSLAIPVGIAIGIGIQSAISHDDFIYNIVNGVFQGLSGGVLIYVALIHMMKEEMERPEFKAGGPLLYIMYTGFLIGAGCMAVIGIWA